MRTLAGKSMEAHKKRHFSLNIQTGDYFSFKLDVICFRHFKIIISFFKFYFSTSFRLHFEIVGETWEITKLL